MQDDWKNAYRRLAAQLIGADPLIGRASLAERLAVPEDDLDQILGVDWRGRAVGDLLTKRGPDVSNV
jgi:hypothetical protein